MESLSDTRYNTNLDSGTSSLCSEYLEKTNEGVCDYTDNAAKTFITPDNRAISKLLNFDDDDEDDLSNSDEEDEASHIDAVDKFTTEKNKHEIVDEDYVIKVDCANNESAPLQNTVVKDFLPNKNLSLLTVKELSIQPGKLQSLTSKLALSSHQDQGDQEQQREDEKSMESEKLGIKLEEVKHIQIVLSKARIETLPIDDNLRDAAKHGRVCFFCLKTKFWLFRRGVQCSMCCHMVCNKCSLSIRVPPQLTTSTSAFPHNPAQTCHTSHRDLSLPELEVSSISDTLTDKGSSKTSLTHPSSDLPSIQSTNPVIASVNSEDLAREGREGTSLTVCAQCKQMVQKVIQCSASYDGL